MKSKPKKIGTSGINLERLRRVLAKLQSAPDFDTAQIALNSVGQFIGLPTIAWAPDVSRPSFDLHMDAFMRKQGWPEEAMTLWWGRNVMLKSPVYIRCRFTSLPFVTDVRNDTLRLDRDARRIEEIMMEMGLRSMITVPIHLPRAQVAKITWAGSKSPDETRDILAQTRTELMAAGHYFMQAFGERTRIKSITEEELSRLTPREWECLRLTAQGHREAETAKLMGLAPTTVRFHLDNAVRKLGASTRTHAVALAAQLGLLGPVGN